MVRSLLIRGMLIGILAGLLAFGFAKIFGEPQVDLAIAYEESHAKDEAAPAPAANAMQNMSTAATAGHDHAASDAHDHGDEELVSRSVQSTFGLFTGVVVYGVAIGGIFALVFAFAQGRIGSMSPRATAGLIALAGFAAIVLVPQLKYPANPPSIGDPGTIGSRTALYFTMIALSVLAFIAALGTAGSLRARLGRWNANLVAMAAYGIVMAIAMLVLPVVNEVPADFSAAVLWKFRVASLGIQLVLWTTLGVGFGIVAQRLLQPPLRGR